MGIKVGGIDLGESLIDAEYRISVLEQMIEQMINKTGGTNIISVGDLGNMRDNALKQLQKKYPDAGIERK